MGIFTGYDTALESECHCHVDRDSYDEVGPACILLIEGRYVILSYTADCDYPFPGKISFKIRHNATPVVRMIVAVIVDELSDRRAVRTSFGKCLCNGPRHGGVFQGLSLADIILIRANIWSDSSDASKGIGSGAIYALSLSGRESKASRPLSFT